MRYILLSEKSWHNQLFKNLRTEVEGEWKLINQKEAFNLDALAAFRPEFVFIPHWSYIIPPAIYEEFECIVFHMTDLPFGRGGSPLQNLIVRGYSQTMISAIKVRKGIDTGEIYAKQPLSLQGTAEEIFIRASTVIEKMIKKIIETSPIPYRQQGEITKFKRRGPADGNISNLGTIDEVFDYIRMLDCDGYPKAFLEVGEFKFEFTRSSLKGDNSIIADVRITKR